MVTANEGKRHQAYAESLGVDSYLQKPVPLARLIAEAIELLTAREAADEAAEKAENEASGPGEGNGESA
jgi:DNA-binding response OmpR family regulator